MPHVVTRACCGDAACVFACPVNCIHPTPDEPDFASAEMLYIDPRSCVDCGACVSACPVGAIKPDTGLEDYEMPFLDLNAAAHTGPAGGPTGGIPGDRPHPPLAPVLPLVRKERPGPLRVAVVGAGPAALYAADALLKRDGTAVTVLDRLPVPHGLVRHGVAPDHPDTRQVQAQLARVEDEPGFAYRLGGERVAVVGNGNVALDVARILAGDPERLAGTDIAPHALEALRGSRVREVVVLGRRGPAQAAFTLPELLGLLGREDIEVVAEGLVLDAGTERRRAAGTLDPVTARRLEALERLGERPVHPGARRIVLRFCAAPSAVVGEERVTGIAVAPTRLEESGDGRVLARPDGPVEVVAADLLLRSIGYRGLPVPDLPHDEATGTVSNREGRVLGGPGEPGEPLRGVYVAGWAKRGPTGFIGTNKSCSRQTVDHLVADHNAGLLAEPAGDARAFDALLRERRGDVRDLAAHRAETGLRARSPYGSGPDVAATGRHTPRLGAWTAARRRPLAPPRTPPP